MSLNDLQVSLSDLAALWHQSLVGPLLDPASILELPFLSAVQTNCSNAGKSL